MLRVRTIFTGYAGTPYYNQMYFDGASPLPVQNLIDAVGAFWNACLINSTIPVSAQVQSDVEEVDVATGNILAVTSGTSVTFTGASTGAGLPPATQALIRLRTGVFVDGRQLQGKVYIPGLTDDAGTNQPSGPFTTALTGAAADLISATAGTQEWSVYSPTKRQVEPIVSASVWSQYAVLRSRRD